MSVENGLHFCFLVERNIRRDYPNVSNDLIELALESSGYKEQTAKTLLDSMIK